MLSPVTVIDRLAFGGSGICRIDGKVCFVPFSCPGDHVKIEITTQKKSYCTAQISELVFPSVLRVTPLCPVFGSCGGCSWQHIDYPAQLQQKRKIFADILWRGSRVSGDVVGDIVAAPDSYRYRSRVQFKVSVMNGRLSTGFFRNSSHVVEDALEGCPVALPLINELLKSFKSVLSGFEDMGAVSQIAIDAGDNGLFAVVFYSGQQISQIKSFFIDHSAELIPCSSFFLQTGQSSTPEILWGEDRVCYSMPGIDSGRQLYTLNYRPGGFAQINQVQNRSLLASIRELGAFTGTEKILDLYCGNGNFSIPLADTVASVVGVEGAKDSIDSAIFNSTHNAVCNVDFICSDVCASLKRLVADAELFDVVLLDPPRNGAADAIPYIIELHPSRIIYVSCDPGTLARDCGLLTSGGYRVVRSIPFDMFPQTYHIESVTLLVKGR